VFDTCLQLCTSTCIHRRDCMLASLQRCSWQASASSQHNVAARVAEERLAKLAHFKPKGGILKRLLHLPAPATGIARRPCQDAKRTKQLKGRAPVCSSSMVHRQSLPTTYREPHPNQPRSPPLRAEPQ
jgi:hypothetical protein